jgi:hypothetical protein
MSDLAYRKNNHCISCQKELDAPRTGRKYQRPRDRDDNRQQIGWLDLLRSRSLCDIRSEIRANFEGSDVPLFDTTTTHAIAAVDRSLGAMTKT